MMTGMLARLVLFLVVALAAVSDRSQAATYASKQSASAGSLYDATPPQLVLAKTIRPTFNAAAKPVSRPPATRPPQPRPKPSIARPAPAPRGLAPRTPTPRVLAQRPATARSLSLRSQSRNFAASIAHAGSRSQARPSPRAAFQAQTKRGALRPGFIRAAKPPLRSATSRESTTLWGTPTNLRRNALRPIFNGSVRNSKVTSAFRRANSYPGAMGPITWRLTKPGEPFYRSHYGTRSKQSGPYASPIKPANLRNARDQNALPPWNKAYRMSRFVGTGREVVGLSRVAPAFGRPGGGIQAYFPAVPRFTPAGWNRGALTKIFNGSAR